MKTLTLVAWSPTLNRWKATSADGLSHSLVPRSFIDRDGAKGPLAPGNVIEPDPDFPGKYVRQGDYR